MLEDITYNTEVSSNMGTSTISIPNDLKAQLNKMKIHHRETYADVIVRLISYAENAEPLSQTESDQLLEAVDDMKAGRLISAKDLRSELGL